MAAHTVPAGQIYFPCGTPDLSDIVDGKVDLDFSVRRELKEETGLDAAEFMAEPGWTAVIDGMLIAMIKILRSVESAEAFARAHPGAARARTAAGIVRYPDCARPRRFRARDAGLRDRLPGAMLCRRISCGP